MFPISAEVSKPFEYPNICHQDTVLTSKIEIGIFEFSVPLSSIVLKRYDFSIE